MITLWTFYYNNNVEIITLYAVITLWVATDDKTKNNKYKYKVKYVFKKFFFLLLESMVLPSWY